jgi:protein involved in polysaccharide export with SLBB domain
MNTKPLLIMLFAFGAASLPSFSQIEVGTSVQITIMGVPVEEKGKIDALYPVFNNGTINLPYIGIIRAAGMQPENLAAAIQNAYRNAEIYTNPTVQVISTTEGAGVREQMVHVGGEVRRPGPIKFNNNLTLYQAIQAAGGESEFGSIRRVILYRSGRSQTLDLREAENKSISLRPEDTIEVPAKDFFGR